MSGFYDMHCHLLPGIDDGAQDPEESLAAMKLSYEQGIRTIVCTPHFWQEEEMAADKTQVAALLQKMQETVRAAGMEDLTLVQGNELYWPGGIPEALAEGRASAIGAGPYVLVEYAEMTPYEEIRNSVRELSMNGYRVILAHVERFDALYREEYNQRELLSMGAVFQMNTSVFKGLFADARTRYWRGKCKEGMIDLIGSDSHGTHYRPPEWRPAIAWIRKNLPRRQARRLLLDNPKAILAGRML